MRLPVSAASLVVLATAAACAVSGTPPPDLPRPGTASVRAGAMVAAADIATRLRAARFVLLGEVHDNAEHHRLQAELLERSTDGGPAPAVVFEMLDPAQQDTIDAFLAEGARDPDAFAARVDWAASGWPAFSLYRPLFRTVLEAGLPIRAGGLPRGGALAPDAPERSAGFGLESPLPPAEQSALLDEMFASHCELMPRASLGPMVEFQRARDARLAYALLRAAGERGRAVLVAGNGHVRDSGVPALLARAGVDRDAIANVGLLEVAPEAGGERDDADRFDFVLFTEPADREDPCERLRERLGASPAPAPALHE